MSAMLKPNNMNMLNSLFEYIFCAAALCKLIVKMINSINIKKSHSYIFLTEKKTSSIQLISIKFSNLKTLKEAASQILTALLSAL